MGVNYSSVSVVVIHCRIMFKMVFKTGSWNQSFYHECMRCNTSYTIGMIKIKKIYSKGTRCKIPLIHAYFKFIHLVCLNSGGILAESDLGSA